MGQEDRAVNALRQATTIGPPRAKETDFIDPSLGPLGRMKGIGHLAGEIWDSPIGSMMSAGIPMPGMGQIRNALGMGQKAVQGLKGASLAGLADEMTTATRNYVPRLPKPSVPPDGMGAQVEDLAEMATRNGIEGGANSQLSRELAPYLDKLRKMAGM